MAEFSRGQNHDKISHGHRLRMAGVHEVMVGFGEVRLEGDMPAPIVDLYTAHEGRLDLPEGAVMGFTPYGEYDIQYQPQLPIMDAAEVPLVPQEFDWEAYIRNVKG